MTHHTLLVYLSSEDQVIHIETNVNSSGCRKINQV